MTTPPTALSLLEQAVRETRLYGQGLTDMLANTPSGARLLAAADEAAALRERVAALTGLAKDAYWYHLMVRQGGPDGSELDYAVADDMLDSLRTWAETQDDPAFRAALTPTATPAPAPDPVERCGATAGFLQCVLASGHEGSHTTVQPAPAPAPDPVEHDHFWSPPNPDGRVQCAFCDAYRPVAR